MVWTYEVRGAGQWFGFIGGISRGGVGSERGRRSWQVGQRTSKIHILKSRNLFTDLDVNFNQQANTASVNKKSESSSIPKWFVSN